jgi:hypothetical protein
LEKYCPAPKRILDIGTSPLTATMHERFKVPVDSIGFEQDAPTPTGQHYHLDLNLVLDSPRNDLPKYDAVVFAEVLEHLPTSPRLVLDYLRKLLTPTGIMILQTPNGVHLTNRIKMLIGRNPFELINENPNNPGHFREYTASELRTYAEASGYRVLDLQFGSYFDARFAHHSAGMKQRPVASVVRNAINRWVPGPAQAGRRSGAGGRPTVGPQ